MRNLLVAGNSTMPSSVGIFNLPPLITCRPSRWCKEHCYGLQGRFVWHTVKQSHAWRLKESKKNSFVDNIIAEIRRRKSIGYIRPHITGDFYSKGYIDKWVEIAKVFPDIIFRGSTRRIDFLNYMKKRLPKNYVMRESTDISRKHRGVFPQQSIKGVLGTEKFFVCIDDCEKCKFHCWYNPEINVVTGRIR